MTARTAAWVGVFVLVLAAALPLAGQTTMPVEVVPSTQPAPSEAGAWTGIVTGTNVYVRSGPGEQSYPCTKLSHPDTVTVVGRTDGWLRIVAPKGCFSVISKTYVQPDATGTIGTVTGDNVWARPGGDLRTENFIAVQKQLNKGNTVEILGEAGDYYKITPPSGAHFYISARYVRRAESATGPSEMAAVVEESPELLKVVPPPTAPAGPSRADKLAAFKDAETILQAEFKKPLDQRDLAKALAAFEAVPLSGADDPLKVYVDARTAFIHQSMAETADLEKVKQLARTAVDKQMEYEARLARLQAVTPPPQPLRLPVAKGVLETSKVFPGTSAIGKRYILLDPHSGQTTAYVLPAGDILDMDKYIGLNVAIFGEGKFDVQLQRFVVSPTEVEVLGVPGEMPQPPKPIIRVRPAPTTTTAPATAATAAPTAATESPAPTTEPAEEGIPVFTPQPTSQPVNEEEYR